MELQTEALSVMGLERDTHRKVESEFGESSWQLCVKQPHDGILNSRQQTLIGLDRKKK